MKASIKKIVLLGHSKKFVKLVRTLFDNAELVTIPWRGCFHNIHSIKIQHADILVICGYDFASNHYEFKYYIDVNVTWPFQVISEFTKKSTKIIYVDTDNGSDAFTFSRYYYAKNLLARKISEKFNNCNVLRIPTVLNSEGKADIHGGLLTKLIFNIFIKFGFVKTISLEVLQEMFFNVLKSKGQSSLNILTPRLLNIRRTLFIDRLLRFVIG